MVEGHSGHTSITKKLESAAFMAAIFIAVPISIAREVIDASWAQIGVSYAVLYAVLGLIGLGGSTAGEKIGWIMILGMFFTIPGIPILCILLESWGLVG